jgi:hypothetical protein
LGKFLVEKDFGTGIAATIFLIRRRRNSFMRKNEPEKRRRDGSADKDGVPVMPIKSIAVSIYAFERVMC